ncbi:hypothetical protein F2P79_010843 [Pimephales promelas]|nr:hypothetical protein F2P79_010843 [Pimephales promelas]
MHHSTSDVWKGDFPTNQLHMVLTTPFGPGVTRSDPCSAPRLRLAKFFHFPLSREEVVSWLDEPSNENKDRAKHQDG